jgi:UDPglucose--hexose-1-phosphate uridylyltransferase
LTGEHILVSPQRSNRPWQGQTEPPELITLPQFDPKCYLCPGNERAGGQRNEAYEHTSVFVNDYPAVLPPPGPIAPVAPHPLLTAQPVDGQCDVITFHPRHDLTLARLGIEDIARIVEEWIAIYKRRGTQEGIRYVQIFEVFIFLPQYISSWLNLYRTKVRLWVVQIRIPMDRSGRLLRYPPSQAWSSLLWHVMP